jgi:hypothetical protein
MTSFFPWQEQPDGPGSSAPENPRDKHWHRCQRVWAGVRGYRDFAEAKKDEFERLSDAIHRQFGEEHELAVQASQCVAEAGRLMAQAYQLMGIADSNLEQVMKRI